MFNRMRGLFKFLVSRAVWLGLLLAIQLAVIIVGIYLLSLKFITVYVVCMLLSVGAVIWLMTRRDNPSYKLAWIIPIVVFPLVGGIFYLAFGNRKAPIRFKKNIDAFDIEMTRTHHDTTATLAKLEKEGQLPHRVATYLEHVAFAPTYEMSPVDFQTPGELHFPELIDALRKAEDYIFMEYFIVHPGYMLDTILDILEQKARAGVDVRFIYDDIGSIFTVPRHFDEDLRSRGIDAICYNRVQGTLRAFINFRNHRKITVIDGKVAFTGGVNLADEYINMVERFGDWHDAALEVRGPAVWSLTCLFLETWNSVLDIETTAEDLEGYRPRYDEGETVDGEDVTDGSLGFVAPFGDSPFDFETVGANIYRMLISHADRYVYIMTPYFIVDNEMMTAIEIAARSGVDVRIITPHIPDKRLTFNLTQSHYPQLIDAGVRVYEYEPGFIHTKACVIDDISASVGTINFDYRSFYLHFECNLWLYKTPAVTQIRDDFIEILDLCHEVTHEDIEAVPLPKRVFRSVLRLFAPLF